MIQLKSLPLEDNRRLNLKLKELEKKINNSKLGSQIVFSSSSIRDFIIYVDNKHLLPIIGNVNYIYITKDEYMMYVWDNDNVIYQPLGLSSIEIDAIIGGNATTDFEKE
jgi:hypothetical protein